MSCLDFCFPLHIPYMSDKQARNLLPPFQHHPLKFTTLSGTVLQGWEQEQSLAVVMRAYPRSKVVSSHRNIGSVEKGLLFILKESTIL